MANELPGLGMSFDYAPVTPLRAAVDQTLEELENQGLLKSHHLALAQSARTMADAVEVGTRTRKASAAAMAMAQLLAVLDRLPQPASVPTGGTWDERVAQLLAEAERHDHEQDA